MTLLPTLLLLLPLPAPSAPAPPLDDTLSLEELLKTYRVERDRILEGYRDQVALLVVDLEAAGDLGAAASAAIEKCRQKLAALGPPAAPLMVQFLDPGATPSDSQKERARQIGLVLAALPTTRAITGDLLDILQRGSVDGRRNALDVLGTSDDHERVGPVLRDLYTKSSDPARGELLGAIARMGGADNEAFVAAILADDDTRVVSLALKVLAKERIATAAPQVLALLERPGSAGHQIQRIVEYYHACDEVMDDDHCDALVQLARAMVSDPASAVTLLELLTEYQDRWSSKVKRELKQLASSDESRIAEAALIGLAKAGDRSARRKLLEPYDQDVQSNARLAQAWERRADLRYKIGDYKGAIKDYQEAQKAGEAYGRSQPEVYVGMARSNCQLGKLKDAYEWLDKAPISIVRLRELATEPVFAELLAHPKYGGVFHLEGQQ